MEDGPQDAFDPFSMMSGMADAEDTAEIHHSDVTYHADVAVRQTDTELHALDVPQREDTSDILESPTGMAFEIPMFWNQCAPIPDALDPSLKESLLQELARMRSNGFELPWKCAICTAANSHSFGSCETCKAPNHQYLAAQAVQPVQTAAADHVLLTLARAQSPAAVEACFAFCQALLTEPHHCDEGIYHYSRAFKLWPALDAELDMDSVPVSLRAEADAVLVTRMSEVAAASPEEEHLSGSRDSTLGSTSEIYELPRPEVADFEALAALTGIEPRLDIQPLYWRHRFPNVVVTIKGTVLVIWGERQVFVRRSEDAGETWSGTITIAAGIHSGGVVVDETTGAILVFVEDGHPPSPPKLYHSTDDGCSWCERNIAIAPDAGGRVPSLHMNEHGITLQHGAHKGRLLRATRWYAGGDNCRDCSHHFTNAIFSDDHGATWRSSGPFPAMGTGEAALAELSDGSIYYNSRRHWEPDGNSTTRRWSALSRDGGATWRDLRRVDDLPDGPQCNNFGLFGGLVRLPVRGRDILLFSNCDSNEERENGTLWASFDAGKTWPRKRQFFADKFGYSALAAGRVGTASAGWIYCFFEGPAFSGHIARFNLAWLFDDEGSGDTWA